MNNIIKRVWNQNRMVNIECLSGAAFQAEDGGHTFQISGIDDTGATVSLSGTVAGVFRRPDNADIALTGSASGGVVSVTLTDDCYAVPGRFGLTIFVTSGGQKTAVYACVGTVANTSGGAVAGETPQDVVDLINSINTAVNSIPADYTDLLAAIAPDYSDQSVYAAGSYRWHDGLLYKNPNPITTAESWTAAHWKLVNIGDEIKTLRNIFGVTTGNLLPEYNAYGWTSASSVIVDRSGYELIVNGTKQNDGAIAVTDSFTLPAGAYSFGVVDNSLLNSGVTLQLVDDQSEVFIQTSAKVVFSLESSKSLKLRVRLSGSTTYNNLTIRPMLFSGFLPETYIPQFSAIDYELRAKFADRSLDPTSASSIVLLGDSIVQGAGSSDFSATGESLNTSVYPTHRNVGVKAWGSMFVSLMVNIYGASCVDNGVSQMNIENVYNNVDVLVPSGATDAIIMCGINDRYKSKSTIQSEMDSLLRAVLTKGARPYVFSTIDFNGATYDTAPEIIQQAIKAACDSLNVPFFDMTTLWNACLLKLALSKTDVYSDTLHPNDRGHELIFAIVRECLEV